MTDAMQAAVDPELFRQALGQFPTGVCVVTASAEGEHLGMTMSSFNSLSLDPPLVLFSVDRRAASLPMWEKATNSRSTCSPKTKGNFQPFRQAALEQMGGRQARPTMAEAPNCRASPQSSIASSGPGMTAATIGCSSREVTGFWSSGPEAAGLPTDATPRCNRPNSRRRFGRWIFTTDGWRRP